MDLSLSRDEAHYLALTIGVDDQYRGAGGPNLRIRLLAAARGSLDAIPFTVTVEDLWLFDMVMLRPPGPRMSKTPEGYAVSDLLDRIWDMLLEAHRKTPLFPKGSLSQTDGQYSADEVLTRIHKDVSYASSPRQDDPDGYTDHAATVRL